MIKRMRLILISVLLLVLAVTPIFVFAGTDSDSGITLTFPDNTLDCTPTFHFTTTGVDASWGVQWDLFRSESGSLVKIGSGSTTGNLDVTFTPASLAEGESEVYGIFVAVLEVPGDLDSVIAKLSGQWRVDCEKVVEGGEGCTPGFWKNHPDVWPIPLDTDFDTTFGRDAFNPDITMEEAVDLKGGQLNALSRHAAAAYLNAVSPVVSYDMTTAEIIAAFQAAFDSGDYNTTKDMFEQLNEQGCPF